MKGREWTEAEREAIVREVCGSYATGRYTLSSCCRSAGVGERTFRRWATDLADVADAFETAQRARGSAYRGELQERAQTAIERLLAGGEYVETVTVTDAEGKVIETRRKVRQVPPSAGAVIATLRAVHPVFRESPRHGEPVPETAVLELLRLLRSAPPMS